MRRRIPRLALVPVVAAGGALTGVLIAQASAGGDPPAQLTVIAGPAAQAQVLATPAFAALEWLRLDKGATPFSRHAPAPSVVFPHGTSYKDALTSLYLSIASRGTLPDVARLGKPLPAGIVVSFADGATALNLDAPFGWDPTQDVVTSPSFSLPGDWPVGKATAVFHDAQVSHEPIPQGGSLDVPELPACQVIDAAETPAPADC